MFVEVAGQSEQPSAHGSQKGKVEWADLSLFELGHDNRMDRTADDSPFDKRARVQPHDRGAVVQRVEVVFLRAVVDWERTVYGDVGKI